VENVPSRKYFAGGALAAALLFLFIAGWVASGQATGFDLAVRDAVHAWASPPLTRGMLAVTSLGAEFTLLALGIVIVWRLAATGRRHQAILLGLGALSAELVTQVLKSALQRPRPVVFFGLSPAETYSFPSGHAFVATVFYALLAGIVTPFARSRRQRAAIAAVTAVACLLIGLSRVYLGYHYPSDVLAGWAGAAAWLALARCFVMKGNFRGIPRPPAAQKAPPATPAPR
jgi:undecaprenyl-diphosphatase